MKSAPSRNANPQESTQNYSFACVAAVLVLLGFLLRIFHIDHQGLWLDETASYYLAAVTRPKFCENGWLYFWLLQGWIGVAGSSDWAMRFPSTVVGTLSLLAIILLGKEIFGKRVGLWSGLFAALNPMHIYYSQEARSYALLVLILALAYLTLWHALKTGSWRYWVLYSLCCLLVILTHYFGAFALLATSLLPILWPNEKQRLRTLLICLITMLPAAMLFAFCFWERAASNPGEILPWVEVAWRQTPPELAVPKSLELLTLGSQSGLIPIRLKQFDTLVLPTWLRLMGLSVFAVIAIVAMGPWADKALPIPGIGRRKAWLLIVLFLPLVVMWTLSFVKPIYVVGRYDMIAFPAVPILLALGMAKVQSVRRFGAVLALGLAAAAFTVLAVKLVFYYGAESRNSAQARAAQLIDHVKSGDVVVFTSFTGITTIYYLTHFGYRWDMEHCTNHDEQIQFACRIFPTALERGPAKAAAGENVQGAAAKAKRSVPVFLGQLKSPNNVLWLIPGRRRYKMKGVIQQGAIFGRLSAFLIDELEQRGYTGRVFIQNGTALIRFTNPSGTVTRE